MCLICVHIEKEKMTVTEARAALGEMQEKIGSKHHDEVQEMLTAKEWEQFELKIDDDGWATVYSGLDYLGTD